MKNVTPVFNPALLLLVSVFALFTSSTVLAQGNSPGPPPSPAPPPQSVKVINAPSEPVPVSGTVNVGNLGSTPLTVQVVNTPDQPATVTGSVVVSNTSNAPLPVRDLNNPARQPVQFQGNCFIEFGDGCEVPRYSVPSGKRLVIEYVTIRALIPSGNVANILVSTDSLTHYLPRTPVALTHSPNSSITQVGEKVTLYADVFVDMFAQTTATTGRIFMTFSGYLVNE